MVKGPEVSRRGVLAGLGGMTFCLAFGTDGVRLLSEAQANAMANAQVTPWVRIAPDGTITILSAGAEMGQGSMTNLPMIVAEEMDADWSKVAIEMAPADAGVYGYMMNNNQRMMAIVGSRATMLYYTQLRTAGAQVRKVMLMNAAERWGVNASTLRTEPSVVINPANGARLTYGEIAAFGKVPSPLPAVDAKELKAAEGLAPDRQGRAAPRHAAEGQRHRRLRHGHPAARDGLRHHAALAGAQFGAGELERRRDQGDAGRHRDRPPAERRRGRRRPLRAGAGGRRRAQGGLEEGQGRRLQLRGGADPRLREDPSRSERADADGARGRRRQGGLRRRGQGPQGGVPRRTSAITRRWSRSTRWPASTMPATGSRSGKARRRPTSPGPRWPRRSASRRSRSSHHQCYLGGGFGRRNGGYEAVEAAQIARAVKRPVKLIWTRTEDLAQGRFRPQSFQCLEAATDASGKVTGWKHCVIGDGGNMLLTGGMRIAYYGVPNQLLELRGISHGVQIKHWRAVAHVFNVFAIESFIDQMAVDANMDPIAFRFERMGATPKARACFEQVAQHVRLEGGASGRPRDRALDLRAFGLARRRRGRDLARPAVGQDQGPQGVGRGRRRHHRVARPGQGQYRERHPLRPLRACCTSASR